MLLTIGEFKKRVSGSMDDLIPQLQEVTGRFGSEEADAWRNSLPTVAGLLSTNALDGCHVFFGGQGHASLEYQLPAASSWCDMVLLGSSKGRASAVVVELKHWAVASDTPGPAEGLMIRNGSPWLHPSRQVQGYTDYIRRFHSEVLNRDASVNGFVFFTRTGGAAQYSQAPNHLLTTTSPIFTTNVVDVEQRFPEYIKHLISEPDATFAENFERGKYKQDRGFVSQIGKQILDPSSSPFVLLENQETALLICKERLSRILDHRDGTPHKHVVLVMGPPGSGKSVVAARLWASLVTDGATKDGDIVVTTTSASQNSNWVHLVEQAGRVGGAGGIVKKATQYHPVSTQVVGRLRRQHGEGLFSDPVAWRSNLTLLRQLQPFQAGAEDNAYLVSLIDEAHALINPESVEGRGQYGFAPTLGPQAYHIIRSSQLTVFFMDPDQGFRAQENTKVEDIRGWAKELGASVDEIDLSGSQFRCAGSKEYVDWISMIRSNAHPQFAGRNASRWRGASSEEAIPYLRAAEPKAPPYLKEVPNKGMSISIAENPATMEAMLRQYMASGCSARILSSYSRKWKTKDAPSPQTLLPNLQDFQISYATSDGKKIWARPWNYVPPNSGDYTLYVQAAAGSAMAHDPLCEVGCPYAVRGFDFDYVGIIWGSDLVWRGDRWIVNPEHVEETGVKNLKSKAAKEVDLQGHFHGQLLNAVWQSYRILLTRPIRGLVLWVEDGETRDYLLKATSSRLFTAMDE